MAAFAPVSTTAVLTALKTSIPPQPGSQRSPHPFHRAPRRFSNSTSTRVHTCVHKTCIPTCKPLSITSTVSSMRPQYPSMILSRLQPLQSSAALLEVDILLLDARRQVLLFGFFGKDGRTPIWEHFIYRAPCV